MTKAKTFSVKIQESLAVMQRIVDNKKNKMGKSKEIFTQMREEQEYINPCHFIEFEETINIEEYEQEIRDNDAIGTLNN